MHFFIFLLYNSLSYTSFFIIGESVIANVKQRQADDTCTENKTLYTATQISSILGLPTQQVNQLYNLIDMLNGNTANWKSTPYEFSNIILNNTDDEQIKAKLTLVIRL